MKRLYPSQALLDYLEHGLAEPAAIPPVPSKRKPAVALMPAKPTPVVVQPNGPVRRSRSRSRTLGLVAAAALAILVLVGLLALAGVASAQAAPVSENARLCTTELRSEDDLMCNRRDEPERMSVPPEWGALPPSPATPQERVEVRIQPTASSTVAPTASELAEVVGWLILLILSVVMGLWHGRTRERGSIPSTIGGPIEMAATAADTVQPDREWPVGVASSEGTRTSQEDACDVLHLAGVDVLVVADGLGGHPGGKRAAQLATTSILDLIRRQLPAITTNDPELLVSVLRSAFARASDALRIEADDTGLARLGVDALRTTALVLVATLDHYVVGGIGDGLVLVRREDGSLESLHEVTGKLAQNLLEGSLGPTHHGEPAFEIAPRLPGDLALLATDGVSDRVTPPFYEGLHLGLREGRSVNEVLEEAMRVVDDNPATFDDNATLGLVWTSLSE